jgi:hypothetical protein
MPVDGRPGRVFQELAAGESLARHPEHTAPAARRRLKNPRTEIEIIETLQDIQATLEVLVKHLGLEGPVKSAIGAGRLKAEQSRLEIQRSLGYGVDADGDSRR